MKPIISSRIKTVVGIYCHNVSKTWWQFQRIYQWYKLVNWRNLIKKWLGFLLWYLDRNQMLLSLVYLSIFSIILFKEREFLTSQKSYLLRFHFSYQILRRIKNSTCLYIWYFLLYIVMYFKDCIFQGNLIPR